jgi:acylphosphatase
MEEHAAFRAVVSGRVQGVFFRDTTQRQARSLNLAGWVRNLPDGSVEVFAAGERAACERLLEFLRVGPPRAAVAGVDVEWKPSSSADGREFEIR